jgi:type II secretory pathway pseudopilin PulG
MNRKTRNESGFALVYGLVVLLLASVGGTALLFMAQKDRTGASDYSQMRSASQAAMTAIKAFEGQLMNNPATAVSLLQGYVNNSSNKFLLGATPTASEQKQSLWGSAIGGIASPQYSARILNFDKDNYFITIEGKGYGNNGGIKKVIASYQLAGLGKSDRPVNMPFGLFLGGQLQNCDKPLSVKADLYLSAQGASGPYNQHFNKGGTIYGNYKTAYSTNFVEIGAPLTITGKAFIQCGVWPNSGPFTINGIAGFTNNFYNQNANVECKSNAYFTSPANLPTDNKIVGTAGNTVRFNSPVTATKFTGFTTETQNSPAMTLATLATTLGMTSAAETPLGYSIPAWGAGVVQYVSGDISAATLDNYWTTHQANGTLFQDEWLVLQLTGTVGTLGGNFTRKAIWITGNNGLDGRGSFYNCSDESNTLIIVNGSGFIQSMGPADNYNFRGLIYVNTTCTWGMTYQFGLNSRMYGAIHHASNTIFTLNSGTADSVRIWTNDLLAQSALQEIVNTGIILAPGVVTPPAQTLVLQDLKIRPTLLSLQM